KTSEKEINNLLGLAKRDINDAKVEEISTDRRFAIAYNAVLQLATILLYCKGYKPEGPGHHFTIFQAMKEVMGVSYYKLADYFDSCRAKRNMTDYGYVGGISEAEVEELIREAERFLEVILNWLRNS
ncbi:MAG: SAV_6107 family HEPN domain-containing protein, partial [Candidatus Omnitrophota bacterium]